MRTPFLHLLGAGPWQVPTIRRAKAMGLRVLVTDGRLERPGFALADQHEVVDIADPEATLAAAHRHGVTGILCDTTDTGVYTAAYVADRLGLPGVGLEAARRCVDKAAMTVCVRAAGIRVPASAQISGTEDIASAASICGYPLIVKPVDAQGGRGVRVIRDHRTLEPAFRAALADSPSGRAIVQRFVRAVEIIVDSLVIGGHVCRLGLACKTQYKDNPTVSKRITYGVTRLPVASSEIDAVNTATLRALGIWQGMVHAEYLVDEIGPMPIDVAARAGGVMIYQTVLPHVSGVDATRVAIELALGLAAGPVELSNPRAANIEFLRVPPGRIESINGLAEAQALPGIAAVHLFHSVGDEVRVLREKEDRLGFVVALADDANQAVALSRRAASMIRAQITPLEPFPYE